MSIGLFVFLLIMSVTGHYCHGWSQVTFDHYILPNNPYIKCCCPCIVMCFLPLSLIQSPTQGGVPQLVDKFSERHGTSPTGVSLLGSSCYRYGEVAIHYFDELD